MISKDDYSYFICDETSGSNIYKNGDISLKI